MTAVTDITATDTHAWKASGPRDFSRTDPPRRGAIARHVRVLRTRDSPRLPAGGLGAGAPVLVRSAAGGGRPARTLDKVVVSGTKITMEAPKLTGFTRDNRAYTVTAEAASQDLTNPTVMELTGIVARWKCRATAMST